MRLASKAALVTGAGSGIGRAIARGYAREGARVAVVDLNRENGEQTVAAIREAGGEAIYARADVADSSTVEAMVAEVVGQFGQIDILVNSAAIQPHRTDGRAHELSEETWDQVQSINLKGVWLCSKYVVPVMLKAGRGAIVHIASPTGLVGCAPGYTAYSTSKSGVFGLTRVMAVDYARDQIRVNAIIPGATETPLIEELLEREGERQKLAALMPLGRMAKPEDVVGLAIFLASDESQFCTGGFYAVDGGLTAI
jgi:NAD(P)-dependent dehydrogenase (short-subunit alcohol dehydrogenase family)